MRLSDMKKHILTLVLLYLLAPFALANVVTGVAEIPENYYADVDGKKGMDNIINALNAIISNHTVLNYNSLEDYYERTDFYADTLWDMYSTCRFTMSHANIPQSEVCDGWNKEHLVCQSWFSGSGGMGSDLFNVYPTDARVNNIRSSYPYGEVNGAYGTGISKNNGHALGKVGSNTFSGYTGKVFEPHDDYKGDFARSFMYMAVCYRKSSLNGSEGSTMYTSNPTNLTTYAQNLLMKWHRQDPVSEKEIDRNQAVYVEQNNRNPFIDYPELAEYIWGDLVGQTVKLADLTATCAGGGGPVIKPKFGVTWSVNGETVSIDSITENKRIQTMPETPESCSENSETFVGWLPSPISGTMDEAPEGMLVKLNDFPIVTADITYYAVFAHATLSEYSSPAVYTYDKNYEGDDWTNTGELITTSSSTYWILKQNTYLESPTIQLDGLSSVTIMMRTYGGTQYNTINIIANGTTIGTLTAPNKNMAEQTWTNTSSLSGNSTLRFESSTSNATYGPAFSKITINATGSGPTYSRYITSCQSATELQLIPDNCLPARKILVGGHIYILMDNQLFNIQGQRVK